MRINNRFLHNILTAVVTGSENQGQDQDHVNGKETDLGSVIGRENVNVNERGTENASGKEKEIDEGGRRPRLHTIGNTRNTLNTNTDS